jgi:hypothetical protein
MGILPPQFFLGELYVIVKIEVLLWERERERGVFVCLLENGNRETWSGEMKKFLWYCGARVLWEFLVHGGGRKNLTAFTNLDRRMKATDEHQTRRKEKKVYKGKKNWGQFDH